MKITKCDGCPEETFDPAKAQPGTLMIDNKGRLCMRTGCTWGTSHALVYLCDCAGVLAFGHLTPFTLATGKYLIEND